MPWERSISKASASKLSIYAKKDGRYDVSWYDQAGKRHVSTRPSLAAAKAPSRPRKSGNHSATEKAGLVLMIAKCSTRHAT